MIAENSIETTKKVIGRPFPKGVSGNAGGRPKSQFGEFIRHETRDGEEIVQKVLKIFRTSKDEKIIMDAGTWLADRGWGKPTQMEKENQIEDIMVNFRRIYE